MSKEVKIKISQPMFEVGELEAFDNNIHSIVEEYSKLMFKEKDQILTQRLIMKQEEEIERLNNILNEIEEYLTSYESISTIQGLENIEDNKKLDEKTIIEMTRRYLIVHDNILDKIKELRGDKEC